MGLNHFAVQVADMEDLTEVYHSLQASGTKLHRNTEHGSTNSVYFFDPDGNRIEFFCNKFDTAEEGLAMTRSGTAQNKELVLNRARSWC